MDLRKYIAKATPGASVSPAEKRPLREQIALPVKRHIFINKDSHLEADVYIALHEAKDLSEPVPDYQVPHFHNTDEFYFFLGNEPDLSGLEGQIKFEGKVHRISAPSTVYIPRGTVHEYKVTKGSGSVVVLFKHRGYNHVGKEPDIEKGNKEAERFGRYIVKAGIRPATEIKFHRDTAPGDRYVFIDGKTIPEASFYTVVRTVSDVRPTQADYVDQHRHSCDTYHILIGRGPGLTSLKAEFVIDGEKLVVESPAGVHVPARILHSQKIVDGSGHFLNFVPRSTYNQSLM